jgi:hypothetical protein
MNVTVVDEDDNGPVFSNTQSNNCTLAGYTASSVREYVVTNLKFIGQSSNVLVNLSFSNFSSLFQGRLETSPGGIVAADGDITGNNVTYSFLYGKLCNM